MILPGVDLEHPASVERNAVERSEQERRNDEQETESFSH